MRALLLVAAAAAAWGPGSARAQAPRPAPDRLAWVGLVRGPLSPKAAAHVEGWILDELDGYEAFRVVDARGQALDQRLMADDAAAAARLRDEGVAHFLRFEHAEALDDLDRAVAVFERRLTGLTDHALLHDILLARAEALYQKGERGAAKAALQNFLALRPKLVPRTETHPKRFVRLYTKARAALGPVGRVRVRCRDPGCRIQLDGRDLGAAPLTETKVRPGKHYLVARWPYAVKPQVVRVAAGRTTEVEIARDGPSEAARVALLNAIEQREGLDAAKDAARRVAGLARASRVVVTSAYADASGRALLFAVHDADGDLQTVIRAPLPAEALEAEGPATVQQLATALFVDQREGELDLSRAAGVRPARGLAALLYQGRGSTEAAAALPPPAEAPPATDPPAGRADLSPPPAATATTDASPAVWQTWWFWTAAGVVLVGAGIGVGIAASRPEPAGTVFEVRLP